jgi:hypothetical protein
MDFLNSQHLTAQDGYAHPFTRAGEFTYSALQPGARAPFVTGTITVAGAGVAEGKGKQYDVVLRWDAAARRFTPGESGAKLTLRPNDFIMFHFDTAVPGQPPCFVVIRSKDSVEGDSRSLKTHDAFVHFFLNPGEYAYRLADATYRISVADHRSMSEDEHQRQVRKPLVIMINGGRASVSHARLVAGQSAIWAVEKGESIRIEGSLAGEPNTKPGDEGPVAAPRTSPPTKRRK